MGLIILSQNQEEIVYSEVFEIEFTESSIKLHPLAPSSFRKWLSYNPVAVAMKALGGENIPRIEIAYSSIAGYKADPGFPVLGSPIVTLFYVTNCLDEKLRITFQPYTILPSWSYNRLQALLKFHRIADQSEKVNVPCRLLTWLLVPLYLALGFYVLKNFSGGIGIFGGVFFLWGVLMIFVTIGEIVWRTIQLIASKQS
jgi:hypothetical protein